MKLFDETLKIIDEMVDKQFVTAQFGDHWKEYALENIDKENLVSIAWKQGRRAMLLERFLEQAYRSLPKD